MRLPVVGSWVRITGGLLATPQFGGVLGWDTPGPLPKAARGCVGMVESWNGPIKVSTNYDESFHGPLPANSGEGKRIQEESKNYNVVRVMDGPLAGTLLNRDLLEFEILTPLEVLAAQAKNDECDPQSDR